MKNAKFSYPLIANKAPNNVLLFKIEIIPSLAFSFRRKDPSSFCSKRLFHPTHKKEGILSITV
jgi:hypothetical protein